MKKLYLITLSTLLMCALVAGTLTLTDTSVDVNNVIHNTSGFWVGGVSITDETMQSITVDSTKTAVSIVNTISTPVTGFAPLIIVKKGDFAYVGGDTHFSILDISDVTAPVWLGNLSGDEYAFTRGMDIVGNYVYIQPRDTDSLSVIDVSNPSNPRLIGTVANTNMGSHEFEIQGNFLYTSAYAEDYFVVVDISNPKTPLIADQVARGGTNGAHSVTVRGSYAYLTSLGSTGVYTDLDIFNISDPYNVERIGGTNLTYHGAHDLKLKGSYLYVAQSQSDTLDVVNVSDPTNPILVATLDHSASFTKCFVMALAGDYLYCPARDPTGDFITFGIIDISDPLNPTVESATILNTSAGTRGSGIAVDGRYAYITNNKNDTIYILDVGANVETNHLRAAHADFEDVTINNQLQVQDMVECSSLFTADVYTNHMHIINNDVVNAALKIEQNADHDAIVINDNSTENTFVVKKSGSGYVFEFDTAYKTIPSIYSEQGTGESILYWLGDSDNAQGSYRFKRSVASGATNGAVMRVEQANSGDDQPTLELDNDGTGAPLKLLPNATATPCNAGNEGGMLYDTDTNKHYGCDGSTWQALY